MVERLSALTRLYQEGDFGTMHGGAAGIVISERRPLAMVQVAALDGESGAVRSALGAAIGLAPAPEPGRVNRRNGVTILWLGTGRWLVVEAARPERALKDVIEHALPTSTAAITDLSHGRTVLRIAGADTRNLLGKGCGIDFHPRAFAVDACAQGLLGHVGALFHAVDDRPSFDIYLARSYAVSVWEWLMESAAEYGCRIGPAAP